MAPKNPLGKKADMKYIKCAMWLHLCDVQEQVKVSFGDWSQDTGVLWVGEGGNSRDGQVRDMGGPSMVGSMFYILIATWFPCMYAFVKIPGTCTLKTCEFSENGNALNTNFLKNRTFPFSDFLLPSCVSLNCKLHFGGPSSFSHTLLLCAAKGLPLFLILPLHILSCTHSPRAHPPTRHNPANFIDCSFPSKVGELLQPKRMHLQWFIGHRLLPPFRPLLQTSLWNQAKPNCLPGNTIRPMDTRASLTHCVTLSLYHDGVLLGFTSCSIQRLNSLKSDHGDFWWPNGIKLHDWCSVNINK